ncbi:MAG: hypothetical protein HUJ76_06905 [Parasporobacterium sp.]|nr:hypothetical protein [Parasporobacterium sp.]
MTVQQRMESPADHELTAEGITYMRIYRRIFIVAFVLMIIIFGIFFLKEKSKQDDTYPVITIDNYELEVSLTPSDEELKQGVTALDAKDGDLTDRVVVESISRFAGKGISNVTYAVVDSNNNVASATRKIVYKDYVSPRFTLKRPLLFSVAEAAKTKISDVVGAIDCMEGDISNRVIVNSNDFNSTQEGIYYVSLQVSNTKGDTIYADVPVEIANIKTNDPVITLSDYLIYLNTGDRFDPYDYVVSAETYDGISLTEGDGPEDDGHFIAKVRADSYVKTREPGVYYADYSVKDQEDRTGRSRLVVIVEEAAGEVDEQ